MEEDKLPRGSSGGWELRWGHIGLAILVVGVLIVAWTVYKGSTANKVADNTSTSCSSSVISGNCTSGSSKNKSATSKSSSQSNGSSKNNSSSNNSSVSISNGSSSKALGNTGPGNTIGLFIVTSIFGFMGHQIYLRRKLT